MYAARKLALSLRIPQSFGYALAAVALVVSCAPEGAGGAAHGGAANGSGGVGLGGAPVSSGGSIASGGSVGQGGIVSGNTGGTTPTGGVAASGGTAGGGGNVAGTSGSGGVSTMPGSGGVVGAGGTSSGGATATGGAAGSSGSGGSAAGGKGGAGGGGGVMATGGAKATGGTSGAGGASGYRPCPTNGSACKIMPFGDSITDGFGTAGSYRVELFRLAHQAGKNITFVGTGSNGPAMVDGVAFPPNHEGHSGFTIDTTPSRSGIAPLVATVMPQFTPHIVTLMIGTNDAIDSYQLPNAPTRLGALIDSIFTRLPNVLLVVGQPIPSQEDALNGRLQTYNAAIPAIVKARADAGKHILLVDMYAPFVAVANYKTVLLKDTWHPNEAGDVILGERWYSVLASSL